MKGSNDKNTIRIEERDKMSRYHLSNSLKRDNWIFVDVPFTKFFLHIPMRFFFEFWNTAVDYD